MNVASSVHNEDWLSSRIQKVKFAYGFMQNPSTELNARIIFPWLYMKGFICWTVLWRRNVWYASQQVLVCGLAWTASNISSSLCAWPTFPGGVKAPFSYRSPFSVGKTSFGCLRSGCWRGYPSIHFQNFHHKSSTRDVHRRTPNYWTLPSCLAVVADLLSEVMRAVSKCNVCGGHEVCTTRTNFPSPRSLKRRNSETVANRTIVLVRFCFRLSQQPHLSHRASSKCVYGAHYICVSECDLFLVWSYYRIPKDAMKFTQYLCPIYTVATVVICEYCSGVLKRDRILVPSSFLRLHNG
jgi:hypothetical protein